MTPPNNTAPDNIKNLPVLWSFRRCPYAMRARLAIKISGVAVHLREIILRDKPAAFINDSPSATVPALRLCDAQTGKSLVIDESIDIMHWALAQNDPDNWRAPLNRNPEDAKAFLNDLDGGFKNNLDRYKYANRFGDNLGDNLGESEEQAIAHRQKGAIFLQNIDDRLRHAPHLSGEGAGFLDFAALPFIRQFRNTDTGWFDAQDWPYLKPWLGHFMTSPLFASIMEKYKPWPESGGQGIIF